MTMFLQATRAEVAKVLTTRMWWVIALVMVGYVALTAGGLAFSFGATDAGGLGGGSAGGGFAGLSSSAR